MKPMAIQVQRFDDVVVKVSLYPRHYGIVPRTYPWPGTIQRNESELLILTAALNYTATVSPDPH